jgi:hypothetical protein
MTQYSRGPVNAPGQDPADFAKFADPSQYISNSELGMGADKYFKPNNTVEWTTLYDASPAAGTPSGVGSEGVSATSFNGGRRRKSQKRSKSRHSKRKSSKTRKH